MSGKRDMLADRTDRSGLFLENVDGERVDYEWKIDWNAAEMAGDHHDGD